MKKIYSFLLTAVAIFSLVPFAKADGEEDPQVGPDYYLNNDDPNKASIGFKKSISSPNTEGIYTITLESFATGKSVKIKRSLPADIVLVLDVSGSMAFSMAGRNDGSNGRLNAMKAAVNAFIDEIDKNDRIDPETNTNREQRLGNRIAIVAYSGPTSTSTTPTASNSIKLDTGWRTLGDNQSITDFTGLNYLKNTAVAGLTANGATMAHFGMQRAEALLSALGDDRTVRTVVFFTDGDPGWGSYWTDTQQAGPRGDRHTVLSNNGKMTWDVANATILSADNIKKLTNETKKIHSKVYSVSIVTSPSACTNVYLDQTSSNYSGASYMVQYSNYNFNNNTYYYINGWDYDASNWTPKSGTKVETKYSFSTTNTDELKNVFESIAGESGGGSEDLGEQTISEVDVVSASFALPEDADESAITVKIAKCVGKAQKTYIDEDDGTTKTGTFLQFSTAVEKPSGYTYEKHVINQTTGQEEIVETSVDAGITVALRKSNPALENNDVIEVNGFDYAGNWCGPVYKQGVNPDTATDADIDHYHGYKLVIEIPILMNKTAVGGPDVATNADGSGIYVNNENIAPFRTPKVSLPVNIHIRKEGLRKGESAKFTIERRLTSETTWTEVSSVFVTRKWTDEEEGENAPVVKVVGMPSVNENDQEFIYRIREDTWDWSYTLTTIKASDGRTIGNVDERYALSTDLITNPFIFVNAKKDNIDQTIRHAESKATNTFKTGLTTNVEYDDSKPRTTTTP